MKIILVSLLLLFTCSCDSSKNLNQNEVLDAFKKANLPLLNLQVYDAETDPLKMLGKPHQYIEKSVWKVREDSAAGEIYTIETFKNPEDLAARKKRVEVVCDQPATMAQYIYSHKNILLRLDHKLPPAEAKRYEDILKSL